MHRNAKTKQKWAIEKLKLDNARRLLYFIDPDGDKFKDIMKNAHRKLEIPMPAAMPRKPQRDMYRETSRTVDTRQNTLVLLKPMNL